MRIAFQGEPGAYSEAAVLQFAAEATAVPCRSFEEVFAAVAQGSVTLGILPMENSIGGSIHRNYDLLLEHELPIVGEVELPVDHCLLAQRGTRLDDVKTVYSHPQALAQCEQFLKNLEGVEILAVYDTAGAALMVSQATRNDVAAVASRRAGELFGLETIASGIQDYIDNRTRFVLVGRTPAAPETSTKTSIVFTLNSTPGALFKALAGFALRGIDLTKLESRPIRGRPWECMFYVDVDVPRESLECGRALAHLGEFSRWVRVLGSYRGWQRESQTTSTASADGAPGRNASAR